MAASSTHWQSQKMECHPQQHLLNHIHPISRWSYSLRDSGSFLLLKSVPTAILLQLSLSCSLNVQYFLPGWLQFPPAEVSPLSSLVVPIYISQFCKDVSLTFNSAYIVPLLIIYNNFPWIKLRLLSLTKGCHECASACPLPPVWILCGSLDTSFSLFLSFPALPGMSFLVLYLTKLYSSL